MIALPPVLSPFGGLIEKLWSHEPEARPSMREAVAQIVEIHQKVKVAGRAVHVEAR